MTTLRTAPAGPTFGVVVHGVDLARATPVVWYSLRALVREHFLLVFPGQRLTDREHVSCAMQFGRVALEGLAEKHAVGFVSNVRPDGLLGSDAASFHIDYGFFPEPYNYLSLHALEVSASGSATNFVNGVLAATTLPPDLRARLHGRSARQVIDPSAPGGQAAVRVRTGRLDESYVHMVRPVLWPHRDTGEEILAVWEQQTDAILPMPADESTALLEELFAHLYQPVHTHVHQWAEGDLVLWDNHAGQHGRPDVGANEPRTLRRVCIGADQDLTIFARARSGMITT